MLHLAHRSETPPIAPLAVRGLTVSYGEKPAVFSVDLTLRAAAMTGIIGPNGAGKSTLIKAALGVVTPLAGVVTAFGVPVNAARDRIAYVPQRASVEWDFPVRVIDVVMMGLYRKLGLLGWVRAHHRKQAMEALERVGMADFALRQIGQLSGGQQQRVFLARALAQEPDLYLLDEPFAGVDAATETAIIKVLHALRAEGKTIAAVHHDLASVEAYFDDIFVMNTQAIAAGPVAETFTESNLQAAYGGQLALRAGRALPGALA